MVWFPDQLYRFRGVSSEFFEEELEGISKGKIWLNYLEHQNDPFEGALHHIPMTYDVFRSKLDDFREYISRRFDIGELIPERVTEQQVAHYNSLAPGLASNMLKEVVIAAFSKSWCNTLMWGHYAENFKGICLEYEYDILNQDEDGPPFLPVHYWKTSPPEYSAFDVFKAECLSAYLAERPSPKSGDHTEHLVQRAIGEVAHEKIMLAMASKHFDWVYEEEYRMLSVGGLPGYYPVSQLKVSSVIFGPRCPGEAMSQVVRVLGGNIAYSKLSIVPEQYSYRREPISEEIVAQIAS